jgi:lipopolysaccharide/colanic/teichoic acid biosynthesis glycosyltransferase
LIDICASLIGLLLLAPLFVVIAVAIKLDSGGPVFFRQLRVGHCGRLFRIYKFRSMFVSNSDTSAVTTRADPRITRVGAFLRAHKLDELPQLINVLLGDMSLVGPRPEVPELFEFYTSRQRDVLLSMRPGITDYASIMFRNESAMLDSIDPVTIYRREVMPIKYFYYERYSLEQSTLTDLRIIAATLLLLTIKTVPKFLCIETQPISLAELKRSSDAS